MHNFSELGVEYMPEDGKKHFAGTVRRLAEIVNTPIVVHDYQTGVKTQLGADRCVVSFSVKDEGWDRRYKFFTTSKEMIQILEKVAEIDGGFPFATVIRAEPFDKGVKYKFT